MIIYRSRSHRIVLPDLWHNAISEVTISELNFRKVRTENDKEIRIDDRRIAAEDI